MRFKAVRFFSSRCSICFVQVGHVVKVLCLLALSFSIKGVLDGISKSGCQAVLPIDGGNPLLRAVGVAIQSHGDLPEWWWPS